MVVLREEKKTFAAIPSVGMRSDIDTDNGKWVCGENQPLWITQAGVAVGCEDNPFTAALLRTDPELQAKKLSREYLSEKFLPELRRKLKTYGKIDKDGEMSGSLILTDGETAFAVSPSFCVTEIAPDGVFVNRQAYLRGVLIMQECCSGLTGDERLLEMFREAERGTREVLFPISVAVAEAGHAYRYLLHADGSVSEPTEP